MCRLDSKMYNIPQKFHIIDSVVSRSAQPDVPSFRWLRDEIGVTDVINFRTYSKAKPEFDEKKVVECLGMRYHYIPSITRKPSIPKIDEFYRTIDSIAQKHGKAHIHCMAGVDRTGMYSVLHKMRTHNGTLEQNINEWLKYGLNFGYYPHLISWVKAFLKRCG